MTDTDTNDKKTTYMDMDTDASSDTDSDSDIIINDINVNQEHADKKLLRSVAKYCDDYFHYLESNTENDYGIIHSLHKFISENNFLTIKQVEILEKMWFRFKLFKPKKHTDMLNDSFPDKHLEEGKQLFNECKADYANSNLWFSKYYINNGYSERIVKGRRSLNSKLLYTINNKQF